MEKLGVEVPKLRIDFSDIVFDLVGFPKDNTNDHRAAFFSREYLQEEWYTVLDKDLADKLVISLDGFSIEKDEDLVWDKITTFIDWLLIQPDRIVERPIL